MKHKKIIKHAHLCIHFSELHCKIFYARTNCFQIKLKIIIVKFRQIYGENGNLAKS